MRVSLSGPQSDVVFVPVTALVVAVLFLVASGTGVCASSACTVDTTRVLVQTFTRNYSAGRVAVINRM